MAGTMVKRLPVSKRALLQRINRRLAKSVQKIEASRSDGLFYRVDLKQNALIEKGIDLKKLEKIGRDLAVLKAWEALEV